MCCLAPFPLTPVFEDHCSRKFWYILWIGSHPIASCRPYFSWKIASGELGHLPLCFGESLDLVCSGGEVLQLSYGGDGLRDAMYPADLWRHPWEHSLGRKQHPCPAVLAEKTDVQLYSWGLVRGRGEDTFLISCPKCNPEQDKRLGKWLYCTCSQLSLIFIFFTVAC